MMRMHWGPADLDAASPEMVAEIVTIINEEIEQSNREV